LCISLNPKEKAIITELAAMQNKKPTEFAKDILLSIKNESHRPTMFIPTDKIEYTIGSKDKCVKVYFTNNEMKAIEHMAKDEPLSRFISRRALQGENVLNIEIDDDDYTFVYSVIEPIYTSIYRYLHNLKSINALDSKVIDDFISELKASNVHLVYLTEYFKKNRASLRKTRLNELRKLSNYYLVDYELISVEN